MANHPAVALQQLDSERPTSPSVATLDIEHVAVQDDPREWSARKKTLVLMTVSATAFIAEMASSIYFPAVPTIQADLGASSTEMALTASLFILFQGLSGPVWAASGEVFGRRSVYVTSLAVFVTASIGCALAPTVSVLIALRVLQSLGVSAVNTTGAGTLADIYESHERGRKMGIFSGAPLMAQAIAPLIGGGLTSASTWRSVFWFCCAYGSMALVAQALLPEPFRQQRSTAWAKAAKRAVAAAPCAAAGSGNSTNAASTATKVKIQLSDVNPLTSIGAVAKKPNNDLLALYGSLLFGVGFCLLFTGGTTYAQPPYNFSAAIIGCILLAFGAGEIPGSVLGGRYSDVVYARMKAANGGRGKPEMRVRSTCIALALLPPAVAAYAWAVDRGAHIAIVCSLLFLIGFCSIWIYSSLLACVVDSNPGQAASAVAFNSMCRAATAFGATQIAGPLLSRMGHGWFYTGWAALLACGAASVIAVDFRGRKRE